MTNKTEKPELECQYVGRNYSIYTCNHHSVDYANLRHAHPGCAQSGLCQEVIYSVRQEIGEEGLQKHTKKTIMERRKQGDKCFWGDSWNWLAIWLAANDFS